MYRILPYGVPKLTPLCGSYWSIFQFLWSVLQIIVFSFFHLTIVLSVFLLFMTCGSFAHCIICLSSVRGLWFIWPLYYLSFFCSWLVVHLAIALSVFLLFMTSGSFGNWIICLSSIHDLSFIWQLYYLYFFCSWLVVHLAIELSVFLLFMTNGSFGHCIICLSSVHRLWLPLWYQQTFFNYCKWVELFN